MEGLWRGGKPPGGVGKRWARTVMEAASWTRTVILGSVAAGHLQLPTGVGIRSSLFAWEGSMSLVLLLLMSWEDF